MGKERFFAAFQLSTLDAPCSVSAFSVPARLLRFHVKSVAGSYPENERRHLNAALVIGDGPDRAGQNHYQFTINHLQKGDPSQPPS